MAFSASAIDGGRVVSYSTHDPPKVNNQIQKVWARETCQRPLALLGPGVAQWKRVAVSQTEESRVRVPPRPPIFKRYALMISSPARFIPIGAFAIWTAFWFGVGIAGQPFVLHNVRIAKAKPSFLLSACRDAISNNMLGQGAYSP